MDLRVVELAAWAASAPPGPPEKFDGKSVGAPEGRLLGRLLGIPLGARCDWDGLGQSGGFEALADGLDLGRVDAGGTCWRGLAAGAVAARAATAAGDGQRQAISRVTVARVERRVFMGEVLLCGISGR